MDCGFYAGSFDPPTLGHRDVIQRGLRMFERLIVGIGAHPAKAPMFTDEERLAMLEEEFHFLGAATRAKAVLFRGLTVEAAREHGAKFLIRGIRDTGDWNYEMQMSGMNAQLAPGIETLFIAASPGTAHITATLVRQIASLGGDVSSFVSPAVLNRFRDKFKFP